MNMYDKLGDLLNETLDAGAVKFIRVESKTVSENEESEEQKSNPFIFKKLSPELEHAYKVLDLSFEATREDLKKAYKEKLMYYHPDRHTGNDIIEKVATKKTSDIILAYNMLDNFLNT